MRALIHLIRRFSRDRGGNVALLFGLALVPLLTAVGAGIDYSMATRMKAKLQSAADAAAVASISNNSPGYLQASLTGLDGAIPNGQADADNIFNGIMRDPANPSISQGYINLSESSAVTKTGTTLTSVVTFSAQVPTTFMKVFGYATMTVGGSSSATGSLPPYLDFYLLLDVSGSMGLPSTSAEAERMQWVSPDNFIQYPTGCTLACHFTAQNSACIDPGKSGATQGYPTNGYCLGYIISRVSQSGYQNLLTPQSKSGTYPYKNLNPNLSTYGNYQQLPSSIVTGAGFTNKGNKGLPGSLTLPTTVGGGGLTMVSNCPSPGTDSCIQLRLDAVGYALNQLFFEANQDQKVTDQFRIGLYPFITDVLPYFELTNNFNGSTTDSSTINYAAANLATLLDTNTNSSLGSGGTHIDTALKTINTTIKTVGTGTSENNRQPNVFLVTDGAIDPQMKAIGGGWSGSNHATTLDAQNTLTSIPSCDALKNRNIVISVLYIPYQKIDPVNASFANDEDDFANNNIQYIQKSLQKCASPGFYYEANSPQEINDAMVKMFKHVLQTAHITQ